MEKIFALIIICTFSFMTMERHTVFAHQTVDLNNQCLVAKIDSNTTTLNNGHQVSIAMIKDIITQEFKESFYMASTWTEKILGLYVVKKNIVTKDGKGIAIIFKNKKEFDEWADLVKDRILSLRIVGDFKEEGTTLILYPDMSESLKKTFVEILAERSKQGMQGDSDLTAALLPEDILNDSRKVNAEALDIINEIMEGYDYIKQMNMINFFQLFYDKEANRFRGRTNEEKWQLSQNSPVKAFAFDFGGTIHDQYKLTDEVLRYIGKLLKAGYPVAFITGGSMVRKDFLKALKQYSGEWYEKLSIYSGSVEKGITLLNFALKWNLSIDEIAKFGNAGKTLDKPMLIGTHSFCVGEVRTIENTPQINTIKLFDIGGSKAVLKILEELKGDVVKENDASALLESA
ncbi:hypothetical protein ACFL3D_02930 [Candidatus Omnitrophota bacterium]